MPDTISTTIIRELVNGVFTGRQHPASGTITASPDPVAFSNPPVGAQYEVTATTATGQTITGISEPLAVVGSGTPNFVRKMLDNTFNTVPGAIKRVSDGYIVAGAFKGTANFGTPGISGSNPASDVTSGGGGLGNDTFIVKYSLTGAHLWTVHYGVGGIQTLSGMAISPVDGAIVLCGSFNTSCNLGGSTFPGSGGIKAFIAKYNSSGAHQWSYAFSNNNNCGFYSVGVNSLGNVVVAGGFTVPSTSGAGTGINFGTPGHPGTELFGHYSNVNTTVTGFSSAGDYQWSLIFDMAGDSLPGVMAIDSSDRIYLSGHFKGGGFLCGSVVVPNNANFFQNVFIMRLGPNGELPPFSGTWAKGYGDTNAQKVFAGVLDSAGNFVLGGTFYQRGNFGGGLVTSAAGEAEAWVAKYLGSDGSYLGSASSVGFNTDELLGLATDSQNNIYAIGDFNFSCSFGGISLTAHYNGRNTDSFVWKLSPSFQTLWAKNFGQNPDAASQGRVLPCYAIAVVCDPSQAPMVIGQFGYTVIFSPSITLSTPGTANGYLMSLTP